MNKPTTQIVRILCESGLNRVFGVYFTLDPNQQDFEVGMTFTITAINRQNGLVIFDLYGIETLKKMMKIRILNKENDEYKNTK